MADPAATAPAWRSPTLVALLMAILACVPWLSSLLGEPFLIRVLTRVVIFAIAATALNFVLGFGGMVSLVHAGLFGIGGYVVAILAYHDFNAEAFGWGAFASQGTSDLLISAPLAALASGLVAALLGVVAVRTGGAYFIMITLAFNQMLYYFVIALQRYGGEDGLQILGTLTFAGRDIGSRANFYYACLAVLAATLILVRRLVDSRFGMVLRAAAQSERRVQAVGIPPLRYKVLAFAISGAITGLAGALLSAGQQFISPADMEWSRSGDLVVMVVMGGLSSVVGPAFGAGVFLILELVLSGYSVYWRLPFGLIIIALAVMLRGGIADIPRLVAQAMRRR